MSNKYSEQIINSFLRELVTEQSPPDLTVRIAAAWERERHQATGPEVMVQSLVLAEPVLPAKSIVPAKPIAARVASGRVRPAAVPSGKLRGLPRTGPGSSFHRNVIAAVLALSACGLLAFLGSRLLVKQRSGSATTTAQGEGAASSQGNSPVSPDEVRLAEKSRSAAVFPALGNAPLGKSERGPAQLTPDRQPLGPTGPQLLDLENLPFALDAPKSESAADRSADVVSGQPTSELLPVLSGADIVRHLDLSLLQLWNDLEVVPTAPLSDQERAEQVVQLLTGHSSLSSAENLALPELVRQSTASRAFAEFWSDKLIRAWFTHSSLPLNDPRTVATQQQIATFIRSGQPFNRLAIELLGGAMSPVSEESVEATEATSVTSTVVSALAGNGNHRLVARIGTNFLDANLACVRCHEANGASSDQLRESDAPAVARQEVYWSLVALLQGIEVQAGNGRPRLAVDRQSQQVAAGKPLLAYYDLLDGRLQAAEARLPSGQGWDQIVAPAAAKRSPRLALAEWLTRSTAMDEATVNLVWKIVMGRPLVSQMAWRTSDASEQLADRRRRELQVFLARQFRHHDHDFKQLVSWIVGSQTVARQPLALNRTQWLETSDAELLKLQLAAMNFAAGPVNSSAAESSSLENSLAAVLKWQGHFESGIVGGGETTLAQPTPTIPSKNIRRKSAQKQTQDVVPTMSYTLHGEQSSPSDITFVSRLLASRRLSWQQCVEHVVLVNPNNVLSGRIKHLADELLRQHSGDTQAALLDLLWAVKNSDAI